MSAGTGVPWPGLDGLLAEGAELIRLATGATWAEGPLWLPERGAVRFSDIPGNRILEYTLATGELSEYATEVEFTNGRTRASDESVIQCSHGRRRVERDADGVITPIVDSFQGARLNSPNDVVQAADGSIWFTDPPYGITVAVEGHPGEREYGGCYVFRYDETTGELRAVITDMQEPNGLAFSPDESLLYVADTARASRTDGNHHIRVYDVADGRCSNGRVFAVIEEGVADGFRVDTDGRVWTSAADGVHILAPDGTELGRIPVPEVVSNVCFGGDDGRTLFMTATTSLYAIATRTAAA